MDSRATDLYISVDVEADGPIPGPFSMLAVGLCVAGRFDGETYEPRAPDRQTLYLELRPISERFDPDALAVSRLDREELARTGADPATAMAELADWIERVAAENRPVICAYPASFDWLFLYWYMRRFGPEPGPLEFSSCLDIKTMFAVKARVPFQFAGRDDLPPELRSDRRHTHNALDDALEQADVFSKLFAAPCT
jgi:DNA polymerase III epsilon subunit-like protein